MTLSLDHHLSSREDDCSNGPDGTVGGDVMVDSKETREHIFRVTHPVPVPSRATDRPDLVDEVS